MELLLYKAFVKYKKDASFNKTENALIGSQIIKRDQYLNLCEKFQIGQTFRLFAKSALRERWP